MGAIAERLVLGLSAAAEGEPVAGRDFELVAVLIDQLRGAVDAVGAVAAYEDRHGSAFVFEHGAASVARALEALRRSDAKQMRPEKRRDDRLKVALDAKPEVAEAGKQLQFRLRAEAANQAGQLARIRVFILVA